MMMGRTFSFRGKILVSDNSVTANHQIFDYVSPDRTRAWKVKEAYVWVVDWWQVALGGAGFLTLAAGLGTDTGKFNQNELIDPSENRLFGWSHQSYNHRNNNVPFVTPNATPLGRMNMLIDPDHLITKNMYLNVGTATDEDESSHREKAYCIIVEEEKVSPAESVFQQIKGIGQDILS